MPVVTLAPSTLPSAIVPGLISILGLLPHARLLEMARLFGCDVKQPRASNDRLAARLWLHLEGKVATLLSELSRDELKIACRQFGLEDGSMRRSDLTALILIAAHLDASACIHPVETGHYGIPREGQVLSARNRQWLVTKITTGTCHAPPLIGLSCIDDERPGRKIDILWHLELGAKIVVPSTAELSVAPTLDPPSSFGAYLDALKWSAAGTSCARNSRTTCDLRNDSITAAAAPSHRGVEVPVSVLTNRGGLPHNGSNGSNPRVEDRHTGDGPSPLEPIAASHSDPQGCHATAQWLARRIHIELTLEHANERWHLTEVPEDSHAPSLAPVRVQGLDSGQPIELILAEKLARYTELSAPDSGQGRLPFVHLQQRLLSSPEAFARSLNDHARALFANDGTLALIKRLQLTMNTSRDALATTSDGINDETSIQDCPAAASIPKIVTEADTLLSEMRSLSAQTRRKPDAKVMAILLWLRQNLCASVGRAPDAAISQEWRARRVILFTEFSDTMRYVVELLTNAIRNTRDPRHRILQLHGGMRDALRESILRVFTGPVEAHPVRILVATDSAIAGLNLQTNCTDLFHVDIPWNPHRLEQRDGPIEDALQSTDAIRCHYFIYPARTEDQVLRLVMRKLRTMQRKPTSDAAPLYDEIASKLNGGLTLATMHLVDAIGEDHPARGKTPASDSGDTLEQRDAPTASVPLRSGRLRTSLEIAPESLRRVVDIGLRLACPHGLTLANETNGTHPTFTLPALDRSWDATLDTLRPPRSNGETFWQWRKKQPRPVTFYPQTGLLEGAEQLVMTHPFVKRILDQYLLHGLGNHLQSRVTAVVSPDGGAVRIVGFARLTLFGTEALRLHDQIVTVAAVWSSGLGQMAVCRDPATAKDIIAAAERLVVDNSAAPEDSTARRILSCSAEFFRKLWPHLAAEAEGLGAEIASNLDLREHLSVDAVNGLRPQQHAAAAAAADQSRLRQSSALEVDYSIHQSRAFDTAAYDMGQRDDATPESPSEGGSAPRVGGTPCKLKMTRVLPLGMIVIWPKSML